LASSAARSATAAGEPLTARNLQVIALSASAASLRSTASRSASLVVGPGAAAAGKAASTRAGRASHRTVVFRIIIMVIASCIRFHLVPATMSETGLPTPSRRTLASGILSFARSLLASLSPSWLRSASNAARLA